MGLDWWEYYEIAGSVKKLREELTKMKKEIKKLRAEIRALTKKKEGKK